VYILNTGYHRLVASTTVNAVNVHRSPQCGTWHILFLTTRCWSGGQCCCWARRYGLETVYNHLRDPLGKVIATQLAQADNRILPDDYTVLDTTDTENASELNKEVEEKKFLRMAKVYNALVMWQGSPNLCATQKESRAQNKQMTAVGYISDTEEIIKASRSNFQHDVVAAFKLSERSPLPPALSPKDLPGARTQVLNIHHIKRIDSYPADSYQDSVPESILDTDNNLGWNGDFNNLNVSMDDWVADVNSDMKNYIGIQVLDCSEHRNVNTTLNVTWVIWPTWRSMKQTDKGLMTVTAMETRRNKGN